MFTRLSSLQILKLDLGNADVIENGEFIEFINSLAPLELEHLGLSIAGCKKIDSAGIKPIFTRLASLKDLRLLLLNQRLKLGTTPSLLSSVWVRIIVIN